jgi:hypothetical protein
MQKRHAGRTGSWFVIVLIAAAAAVVMSFSAGGDVVTPSATQPGASEPDDSADVVPDDPGSAEPDGTGQVEYPNSGETGPRAFRAFRWNSWWNTPVSQDAPTHPHATEILDYLRTAEESGPGCLTLAGAGSNRWGHPIYWAKRSDPEYDVTGVNGDRPDELDSLRIPLGAEPADNSDGHMSIYDRARGYVVALTDGEYDEDSDTWTASGATVTYLRSNGLHVGTGRSDEPRNRGSHRGNNGATMAVPWAAVQAGEIRHVLKVASGPEVSNRFVFPMVGSDGEYDGTAAEVPPQGLRFRIKPDLDLRELIRDDEALVIAEALQRYGFYIGDSGGTTALKLEDTVAQGRGQLWGLEGDALCALPFTDEYWDVLVPGYDPSR